jgi:hypothetical protein
MSFENIGTEVLIIIVVVHLHNFDVYSLYN